MFSSKRIFFKKGGGWLDPGKMYTGTLVQYPEGFDSDLTLHFLRLGLTPNLLSVRGKFIGLIHKIQIRTICTL